MSFLKRIHSRTIGSTQVLRPKGFISRVAQQEEMPEEANPLRRQAQPAEPEEAEAPDMAQTLKRQSTEQPDEPPEQANPLRRAASEQSPEEEEEAAQTLRREAQPEPEQAPEEENAQPVRREALEHNEEESAQLLRREVTEQKEEHNEEQNAQALRRDEKPEQEPAMQPARVATAMNLSAENSEPPEELGEEPPTPVATALRREPIAALEGGFNSPDASPSPYGSLNQEQTFNHFSPNSAPNSAAISETVQKPMLQIDQIDVLVQEPAGVTRAHPAPNHSRAVRTRYLRRL